MPDSVEIYRNAVKTALRDGIITQDEMDILDGLKKNLGISNEDATEIISQEKNVPERVDVNNHSEGNRFSVKKDALSDIEYTYQKAMDEYSSGNYDKARETFEKISEDRKTKEVFSWLGFCCTYTGDYVSALKYFNSALKMDPNYEIVKKALSMVRKKIGID